MRKFPQKRIADTCLVQETKNALQNVSLPFHFNQAAIRVIFIRFSCLFLQTHFEECPIKLARVVRVFSLNYLIRNASSSFVCVSLVRRMAMKKLKIRRTQFRQSKAQRITK